MDVLLGPVEVRVLGSLIEKQVTTPEYYPLTLNTLVNACNQTTNRDPVTTHNEGAVSRALETLREKGLVWVVQNSRVPKYGSRFGDHTKVSGAELAALCVLLLRGPQTAGEIRARTGRLHAFGSLEEVDRTLETLMQTEPPFVAKLPRLPGTKEPRYAHLLGGPPEESEGTVEPAPGAAADDGRIAVLEGAIETLKGELAELRLELAELKRLLE